MPEANKEPVIKLFGRTISLPRHNKELSANDSSSSGPAPPLPVQDCWDDHSPPSSSSSDPREVSYAVHHEAEKDKEPSRKELTSVQDDEASHQTTEDLKSPTSSGLFENPKTPSAERETSLVKSSNNNNGAQSETSVSQPQDKTPPKKPDKILSCPRCSSMDTKFCYFNNYNVSQPRHFCKNCQRYWTAGGTMRNVPIGAGRRKNKNSSSSCASHYRQVMVPEALQGAKLNSSANGLHNVVLGNGGGVLTFGSDPPLCDSMASVLSLSLAEKTQNGVPNGFHAPKQYTFVSYCGQDNHGGDGNKVGASVNTSTSSEKNRGHAVSHELVDKSCQGSNFPPQLPCFPVSAPWPYPRNPSMAPPPALCQPGCPMSFYPPPTYWGCVPPSWSVHSITAPSAAPNSPTLGKHSRDGNMLSPVSSQKDKPGTESNNNSENGVLMSKTLRIDDPGEAARSSVWSTLGMKNIDKANSLNGGLFKAFPSKGSDDKHHVVEASKVLQANPAALSRSLIFHERT